MKLVYAIVRFLMNRKHGVAQLSILRNIFELVRKFYGKLPEILIVFLVIFDGLSDFLCALLAELFGPFLEQFCVGLGNLLLED
jgi:hypothetical protein